MIEVGTMIVPSPSGTVAAAAAAAKGPIENRETSRETNRRNVSPLSPAALTTESGATVFIGGNGQVHESRESNGYALTSRQQAAHVVKIKISPDDDKNGKVISTVRLTLDDDRLEGEGVVPASVTKRINESGTGEDHHHHHQQQQQQQQRTCLRISVAFATGAGNGKTVNANANANANANRNGNGKSSCAPNSEATCNGTGADGTADADADANVNETAVKPDTAPSNYLYNPCPSPLSAMVMSSGQCSPSDTLDSGTCSDLDGTPPPLPKKKNAAGKTAPPPRKPSSEQLIGSAPEIDSDDNDNESNISCDSLNGTARRENRPKPKQRTTLEDEGCWDLAGHTTPEKRRAEAAETNGPVVRECTYEERKLEQARIEEESAAADFYANYNRSNGTKYLYDDDRFYKFHVNELRSEDEEVAEAGEEPVANKDTDECFAGYKLLEREAIRSAKGTVRGVKNRVRAGIATFLQKPSAKDYKAKDAGKVVVYTTTSGIIRSSYYNCIKVNQILRTHMAKYEERDLFRSMEHQTELKDRLNSSTIELPQLFIDGQYIGDVETVDRLNETGELRRLLKPYKVETKISFTVCALCGGFRMLLCEQCNGSKRSVFRNGFTTEFVGLRCMKCNEVGLVPCYSCNI